MKPQFDYSTFIALPFFMHIKFILNLTSIFANFPTLLRTSQFSELSYA